MSAEIPSWGEKLKKMHLSEKHFTDAELEPCLLGELADIYGWKAGEDPDEVDP